MSRATPVLPQQYDLSILVRSMELGNEAALLLSYQMFDS